MKDAKGHGSNGRGRKPLEGHPYHNKSDAELRYIIKDAGEAARASRGLSSYNPNSGKREDTEGKYADQVNDASTVLAYRRSSAASDNAAAGALGQGHPKSDTVAPHSAMSSRDTDAFGRPRSDESKAEYDEYSRDLSLRSRNGQVGSGMKFRG